MHSEANDAWARSASKADAKWHAKHTEHHVGGIARHEKQLADLAVEHEEQAQQHQEEQDIYTRPAIPPSGGTAVPVIIAVYRRSLLCSSPMPFLSASLLHFTALPSSFRALHTTHTH